MRLFSISNSTRSVRSKSEFPHPASVSRKGGMTESVQLLDSPINCGQQTAHHTGKSSWRKKYLHVLTNNAPKGPIFKDVVTEGRRDTNDEEQ